MNDERDPRDTWPEQDAPPEPTQADETPAPMPRDDAPEPMPSGETPEPMPAGAAPSEGGAAAQPESHHEPPPSDVEAYGQTPQPPSTRDRSDEVTAAHTVPATGIGESTQCPRCGTENRPGLAFCRNCGQRLVAPGAAATLERPGTPEGTQACPRCGTHNRAGVAFCQNCGANLRGAPAPGYVPPAVEQPAATPAEVARATRALLGPIVLLIGAVGLVVAWLLPFLTGSSLYERAAGSGGYGVSFWTGFNTTAGSIADQIYYTLGALAPILVLLLVVLAIAGFMRAAPGSLQLVGLVIALLWAIGLAVLFVVAELLPAAGGSDLISMLRSLSPAGIIFLLASLIVILGALTRFGRS